jgi:hypothetical protein
MHRAEGPRLPHDVTHHGSQSKIDRRGLSPVGAHGFGYALQLATNGEDGFGADRRAAEHTNHHSSHMDGKLSAHASFRNKHECEPLSFIQWL